MRARCNQACAVCGLAQPRLFRWPRRHLHPRQQYRAGNIWRPHLVQPLDGKPNLLTAIGVVDVNADAWQSLDPVLIESEATVSGNGNGWLATQPRGMLRKLDKGEKPIFFYAHEASHVIGRGFHAIATVPAIIGPQARLPPLHADLDKTGSGQTKKRRNRRQRDWAANALFVSCRSR